MSEGREHKLLDTLATIAEQVGLMGKPLLRYVVSWDGDDRELIDRLSV